MYPDTFVSLTHQKYKANSMIPDIQIIKLRLSIVKGAIQVCGTAKKKLEFKFI